MNIHLKDYVVQRLHTACRALCEANGQDVADLDYLLENVAIATSGRCDGSDRGKSNSGEAGS